MLSKNAPKANRRLNRIHGEREGCIFPQSLIYRKEESITPGSTVILKPTKNSSNEFRNRIESMGKVEGTVIDISDSGTCTVLLPKGISIEGCSLEKNGQHYIDLDFSELRLFTSTV